MRLLLTRSYRTPTFGVNEPQKPHFPKFLIDWLILTEENGKITTGSREPITSEPEPPLPYTTGMVRPMATRSTSRT
jgi:hypothetical protein